VNLIRLLPICFLALSIAACTKKEVAYKDQTVESLYNSAYTELLKKEYEEAGKLFDETERQHPYSEWATRAQLMAAYSYFMAQKYGNAMTAIESFIQLHPGHRNVDYALYMKGMIQYEQIPIVQRDQDMTEDALRDFQTLVRRFPHSKYTAAARPKIELIRDHLAGKEMYTGRYYLNRRSYIAAIGRFQTVLNKYQKTNHVPEALHRLVESYTALGMDEEAKKVGAVLGHNYPGSSWYADTYYLLKGKDFRLEHHRTEKASWYKKLLK